MGGIPVFIAIGGFLFLWGIVNYSTIQRVKQIALESLEQIAYAALDKLAIARQLQATLQQQEEETSYTEADWDRLQAVLTGADYSTAQKLEAENQINQILQTLLDHIQHHPSLSIHERIQSLKAELKNIQSNSLKYKKRYKLNLEDYQQRISSFPTNIIAGIFQFKSIA